MHVYMYVYEVRFCLYILCVIYIHAHIFAHTRYIHALACVDAIPLSYLSHVF
jgi:hypothetical protein